MNIKKLNEMLSFCFNEEETEDNKKLELFKKLGWNFTSKESLESFIERQLWNTRKPYELQDMLIDLLKDPQIVDIFGQYRLKHKLDTYTVEELEDELEARNKRQIQ